MINDKMIKMAQEVGVNGTTHCGGNLLELFYKDPQRWG